MRLAPNGLTVALVILLALTGAGLVSFISSVIGSVAVSQNDKLVGMITDRDIALRCCTDGFDPAKATAHEVMTQGVKYCFDDQDIEDAAHVMEQNHIRRLPVLNRSEKMIGFLSVADISTKASHELGGEVLEAAMRH